MNLKHRNLKNPIFAPFFPKKKKAIFRILANNWTQKIHKMITEHQKSAETPIFIVRKWRGPVSTQNLDQLVTIKNPQTWPS